MLFGSKESKIAKFIEKGNAAGLIKLISGKDMGIVTKAIEALGSVKGDDAYNQLISLLRSEKSEIRAAAVKALGIKGDQKAKAHIDHLITEEKDSTVLAAMKEAQAKLHSKE